MNHPKPANRQPVFITRSDRLSRVMELYEVHPEMRLLPVVDSAHRPVGAIFEKDFRRILFSPFGHSLLRNPGLGSCVDAYIRDCPMVDVDADIGFMLDAYASADGKEGMILTRNGVLESVLDNETLLKIAAAREAERIDRMTQAVDRFHDDTTGLAALLADVAARIHEATSDTTARSSENGARAQSVAGAALQVQASMSQMADESRGLALALDRLHAETNSARTAAEGAVKQVRAGTAKADSLVASARSIESVLDLIQSLARRVNLLALNASIEAARAGDAGRGFAVVAQEVKALANQTSDAAQQVAHYVRDIDTAVADVVAGHLSIEQLISSLDTVSQSVNATVESQSVVTRSAADNVVQVVQAGTEIYTNIDGISRDVIAAASQSQDINRMAQSLLAGASDLKAHVAQFVGRVQAA
ncbi:methyl-accepting chemotaxis protein [Sphingobium subterraneum]